MNPELTDDSRELLEHFAGLPADDRARILSLIRNLSICHAVESSRKGGFYLARVTGRAPALAGSIQRSPR